ncbi:MAG: DUF2157 domain-containing protein [Thermoguttaceae bacterium]|nr:DUF2157 domain-containing protein [Thermoguttaceae bacterium]
MPPRTITQSLHAWLCQEMAAWREAGVLTEPQSAAILELYETRSQIAQRQRSMALLALMGLAALLMGLAVLLLVGYNWAAMPRAAKLAVIFGSLLAAHGAAFWLRYGLRAPRLSEVAFLLAALLYGAGIWLVAQVFHIQSHYPNGIWIWAVGVLLLALALDTLLLHTLLVALLALWVGTEILGFGHLSGWLFGGWGFLPNAAYSLPLLALPGVLWAYRKRSPAAVGLYVPLLAWWLVLQPVAWRPEAGVIYFIGATGALLLLIAESHPARSPMAVPYRLYGTLVCAGTLVLLSFFDFNNDLLREGISVEGVVALGVILLATILTVLLAAWLRAEPSATPGTTPARAFQLTGRPWLPLAMVVLMAVLGLWSVVVQAFGGPSQLEAASLLPTLLANVALIALAMWLMHVGLREDRGRPFTAGVLLFLLWAVLRYIDLFGDFGGMLGAALLFFLCSLTLFGVAMFWRSRKEARHG